MPQSLSKRFNGNAKDVIEYTRIWGQGKAMDKYEIKDYIAFTKFLKEKTGDEHFGIRPALSNSFRGDWAEDLLNAFTNKLLKMETELQELRERNHNLTVELEYHKAQAANHVEPKVREIMRLCQEA